MHKTKYVQKQTNYYESHIINLCQNQSVSYSHVCPLVGVWLMKMYVEEGLISGEDYDFNSSTIDTFRKVIEKRSYPFLPEQAKKHGFTLTNPHDITQQLRVLKKHRSSSDGSLVINHESLDSQVVYNAMKQSLTVKEISWMDMSEDESSQSSLKEQEDQEDSFSTQRII